MSPEQRDRIEAVFEAALDLPSEDRHEYVTRECADDDVVRNEVLALLDAHDRDFGILESSPAGLAASLIEAYQPGARLGPYRLVREIGRGGMGVVYLAERDDGQFRRSVAIKVMRAGADPGETQRRLEAERQILASLDHPHIARLFDGGFTANGQPYLVMEYIEGRPIDVYCDAERLSIEERLELFAMAARAVHYAHRRLIVHRDLKPSNILVTADGEPKLLDFGIAKILDDSPLGEAAPLTRTGLRLLTPEYASPEQIRGAPVTTSNDVYALGIVLYELLTGRRPFDLREKTASQAERVILWQDAPRPSTLITRRTGNEAATTSWSPAAAASARRSNPARLGRRLGGDLDRLVLMAIRKEPERRYTSAEQFADDIDRHLEGRPVLARGDSAAYRARKFMVRHRWGVLAAATIAMVLLGGIVATATQARRASAQRSRAEQEAERSARVASVMMDLFRLSDPNETLGDTITARQMLDRGTDRILREFGDQPDVQAAMLSEVARVYANLGLLSRAEPLVRQSLDLRRAESGESSLEVSEGLLQLGQVLSAQGRRADAVAPFRGSIAIRETAAQQPDSLTAVAQAGLAWELRALGNHDEAADLFSSALEIQRTMHGESSPAVATTMLGLASSLHDNGRFDEAEALFQRALGNRDAGLDQPHPMAALALLNIGMIRRIREQYVEALPLLEAASTMRRTLYDEDHPLVLEAAGEYAIVLENLGRYAEAEQVQRDGLAASQRTLGGEHPRTSSFNEALATTLSVAGRYEEAVPYYDASIAAKRRRFDGDHAQIEYALIQSSDALVHLGRFDDAERRLREAIAMGRRLSGERHVFKMLALRGLARLELERGGLAAAGPLLDEALSIGAEMLRPDHRYTLSVQRELARLRILQDQPAEAIDQLVAIRTAEEAVLPSTHANRAHTSRLLGRAYLESGDAEQAERALRTAIAELASLPESHWQTGESRSLLGAALAAQGRTAEARPFLEEGLRIIRAQLGDGSVHTREAQSRLSAVTGD